MEIQLWKELLEPYEQAVDELVLKFRYLREAYLTADAYSPIESVKGRVKSIRSILEKINRKKVPFERMEEEVEDIAGIRIICQFTEDIRTVVDAIRRRTDITVVSEKDYLTRPKDSGYRSFHMIVAYTVQRPGGPKRLLVEIQIRTMAMNFWATTEHSLQYKYKGSIPAGVVGRLSEAADAITKLDEVMSTVRSDIIDAQIDSRIETRIVKEILTTIGSLYRISTEREIRKIQDEFYRIYQTHDLDELMRFHKELDLHAEGFRAQELP